VGILQTRTVSASASASATRSVTETETETAPGSVSAVVSASGKEVEAGTVAAKAVASEAVGLVPGPAGVEATTVVTETDLRCHRPGPWVQEDLLHRGLWAVVAAASRLEAWACPRRGSWLRWDGAACRPGLDAAHRRRGL
jgi:hypothetical protein